MGFYAEKWSKRIAKRPEQRLELLESARTHFCSLILGRGFGEPVETFLEKNPEIKEFKVWLDAQR